jgi:DeoR/GlpR family transcriptional regulator of sugar metabolism
MLARQRQERILDEVRNHGGVRVGDLVELLQVSDMTVRRDIESLARRGLVERVHGGATTIGNRSSDEPGFVAKSRSPGTRSGPSRARRCASWNR